jgi:DNA-binding response OmpR family regulator
MMDVNPVLLVVDDEPGILRLTDRFARKIRFDVATAGSGQDAVRKLQDERRDCCGLDAQHAQRQAAQ